MLYAHTALSHARGPDENECWAHHLPIPPDLLLPSSNEGLIITYLQIELLRHKG